MPLHIFRHVDPDQGVLTAKHKFGQGPGQQRLSGTRRAPKDDRGQISRSRHPGDRPIALKQMILTDDIGQLIWPQPVCQGMGSGKFKERTHILHGLWYRG